jgi:hypothetical protein
MTSIALSSRRSTTFGSTSFASIKAHSLNESDNPEIDAFASILIDLAQGKNVAVDLLSHERKAMAVSAGGVNRGRGPGALKDAGRLFYTITGMSEADAEAPGVKEAERKFLVRLDSAKVNIAPPAATTTWFGLVGVNLGNAGMGDGRRYSTGSAAKDRAAWKAVQEKFPDLAPARCRGIIKGE